MRGSAPSTSAEHGTDLAPDGLTVPEVAAQLRCGARHVWDLVGSGELASFKWLGRRLVKPEAVRDYVRRQMATNNTQGSGSGAGTGSGSGTSSGAGTGTGNGGAGTGPTRAA